MSRLALPPKYIIILPFVAYLITNFFRPAWLEYAILSSICWLSVAVITFFAVGTETFKSWYDRQIMWLAIIIGVAQVVLIMDTGLFFGFGQNPTSLSIFGLMTNTVFTFSRLLGMEFSRAFIMKFYGTKRSTLALTIVTILFAIISMPTTVWYDLMAFSTPLVIVDRLGTTVVPILAQNALATYLALMGGPVASIAYMAPILSYELYLPILPRTTWALKTLLGVLLPFLGFVYINKMETPQMLRRVGIKLKMPLKIIRYKLRSEKKSSNYWYSIMVIGILALWFSTGLLGVFPTIPISGSMSPTMEVGDVAIVVKTPAQEMEVGDIIQFSYEGTIVLHRIMGISGKAGALEFTTKGDANTHPEQNPVHQEYVQGKVVAIIPKLGWVTIYLREFYSIAFATMVANLYASILFISVLGSGVFAYYLYSKKGKTRNVRRRGA